MENRQGCPRTPPTLQTIQAQLFLRLSHCTSSLAMLAGIPPSARAVLAHLEHDEIVALLLVIGTLLTCARLLGELLARLHQPAIVGELLAGVLLGPTVLERVTPQLSAYLFPKTGPVALALSGLTNLSLVLFLLVAGLEVDLSAAVRRGRAAVALGLTGIIIPFGLGFLCAYPFPLLFGKEPHATTLPFALFFATALSISALPVIAKTLMDLHLLRSDIGAVTMAAAVFNDLAGWMIFAGILGMIGSEGQAPTTTILLTIGYWAFMLVVGRWAFDRILPLIQAYARSAGGVLTIAASVALFAAAFTEWIGVHAIFGSFMVGVAFGDSRHLRQPVRHTLNDFISHVLAPLFFASIGLTVDFLKHFDLTLVLLVFLIATIGKIVGCVLGGWLGGLLPRERWAAAVGMNARGAMEIVLGLLGLRFGLIGERLFVALVIVALLTSMMSGPLMKLILQTSQRRQLLDFTSPRLFLPDLPGNTPEGAVQALCEVAANAAKLSADALFTQVTQYEGLEVIALGHGLAVPHARLPALQAPIVAVGLSLAGIDFNSPDGQPTHTVLLLLTPEEDSGAQLELLSDIARRMKHPAQVHQRSTSYVEWRADWLASAHLP